MKLKTVTLIAAVAQLLSLFCTIYNFAQLMPRLRWAETPQACIMQPIYLVARVTLVLIFCLFYVSDKSLC